MAKEKLIPIAIKFTPTLWEKYGDLVERLKRAGFLEKGESRSSLIKDFVAMFLVIEEARLKELTKDLEYYEEEEKKLEEI